MPMNMWPQVQAITGHQGLLHHVQLAQNEPLTTTLPNISLHVYGPPQHASTPSAFALLFIGDCGDPIFANITGAFYNNTSRPIGMNWA